MHSWEIWGALWAFPVKSGTEPRATTAEAFSAYFKRRKRVWWQLFWFFSDNQNEPYVNYFDEWTTTFGTLGHRCVLKVCQIAAIRNNCDTKVNGSKIPSKSYTSWTRAKFIRGIAQTSEWIFKLRAPTCNVSLVGNRPVSPANMWWLHVKLNYFEIIILFHM